MNSTKTIAVFGGSGPVPGSPEYQEAFAIGQMLVEHGFDVMNGGYAGTMEASARGARKKGGRVVGVVSKEFDGLAPNDFLDETVQSDDLFARIRTMQRRADGFIVLKGSIGTLAELALVWNISKIDKGQRKPIVLLGKAWEAVLRSWREHLALTEDEVKLLYTTCEYEDAVKYLSHVLHDGATPLPRSPSPAG